MSRLHSVQLVEVFNKKSILNVLSSQVASPCILSLQFKKQISGPRGPSSLVGVASLRLPGHFLAWTELSLGSQSPPSRKCLEKPVIEATSGDTMPGLLVPLTLLLSEI